MLNAEDNKLITQVGPGTPMGELFRRYWLPAMLATELPAPDCPPVKLRLLGEDMVAFRATSGRVGVIETWCPHRNANLFWGRNEEEGLRCVYHGWKFDAEGRCVDMPNEPPTSRFNTKVSVAAYPAQERGGVIWVYMGPTEMTPRVPDLEWTLVPESHRYASKRIQMCNWLQNLEGEVDSSHVSFLHSNVGPDGFGAIGNNRDRHPVFAVAETDFGLAISARRDAGPDEYYWRITPYMMPAYTIIPGRLGGSYAFTGAVPIDDTSMIGLTVIWRPEAPLPEMRPFVPVDDKFHTLQNKSNDYLIDRQKQKTESFSGIDNIRMQDVAVQEDQRGPLSERTKEHLGTSDLGVIATRRRLLKQVRNLQKGIEPTEPHNPSAYRLHSLAENAARSVAWEQLMRDQMILTEASFPGRT